MLLARCTTIALLGAVVANAGWPSHAPPHHPDSENSRSKTKSPGNTRGTKKSSKTKSPGKGGGGGTGKSSQSSSSCRGVDHRCRDDDECCSGTCARPADHGRHDRKVCVYDGDHIDVMTANLYLGAYFSRLLSADPTNPVAFNEAVLATLAVFQRTNFLKRAKMIAKIISHRKPDVLALQEVTTMICVDVIPDAGACDSNPAIAGAFAGDYLAVLLEELSHLGVHYDAVATVVNIDPLRFAGVPFNTDPNWDGATSAPNALLQYGDRDVVLVRKDDEHITAAAAVELSPVCALINGTVSADGCLYPPEIVLPFPPFVFAVFGTERNERGFGGVDVTVRGRDYRIFNTHLETSSRIIGTPGFFQSAQALTLVNSILPIQPPGRALIVTGDFNSDPTDAEDNVPPYTWCDAETGCQAMLAGAPPPLPTPYSVFARNISAYLGDDVPAGPLFTDAWNNQGGAGATFGQDEDLSNVMSFPEYQVRLDQIFSFDPPKKVTNAKVLGAQSGDKVDGLWASDHGFFAATLVFDSLDED